MIIEDQNAIRLPSRAELKAMIRMELWHVLGRLFDFTPVFIPTGSKSRKLVIDWRCVPQKMYLILNNQDAEALKRDLVKIEMEGPRVPDLRGPRKRERLFFLQVGKCFYCKRKTDIKEWSIDHIKPISRGGKRMAENEVGACKDCNGMKSNRTVEEFLKSDWLKARLYGRG